MTTHLFRIYSDALAMPEPTTLEREADARADGGGLIRPALCVRAADAMHAVATARAYALDCERTLTPDDPRASAVTEEPDQHGRAVPVITLARPDRPETPEERRAILAREAFFARCHADRIRRVAKRIAADSAVTGAPTTAQEA